MSDIKAEIARLRNEINCRIEHGAQSCGHLEFVQGRLDALLAETSTSRWCCGQMQKASTQSGADNEGYGMLIIAPGEVYDDDGVWSVGCGLDPIKFCPWCGTKLETLR